MNRAAIATLTETMVFRRRPTTPEAARIAAVRDTIARHAPDSPALDTLDDVERSLDDVVEDRERLRTLLDDLGPQRATAELKAALRARPSPLTPDTPEISSLRRRHDAVHSVANRLTELERRIDRTLIDLDTLATQTAVNSVATIGDDESQQLLDHLNDHAAALAAAHEELAALERHDG